MPIERFSPTFSQAAVDDLRNRLAGTRWIDEMPGSGWQYGFNLEFLKDLCRYWRDEFDWKAQIEKFLSFEHYRYPHDGTRIHFIHERGKGTRPLPLIVTHGWPGSFVEMLGLIPMLADPTAFGGDAADAFDVIVPSLPGFGYSDRPSRPGMNLWRIADTWAALMRELGYDRFAAQGGDFGAGVSTALGLRQGDRLLGIHLNYIPGSYQPYVSPSAKLTPAEQEFVKEKARWFDEHGAYAHIQRTHPATAAYGLNDSPAALTAWIVEKFRDWSDCNGDVYDRFMRDPLLSNVTLYWMTETIHSSFRLYWESARAPLHFRAGDFISVPCAIARFPKEAPFPPREWVERGYNVQQWTEMPRGGHFAAAEEPELLAEDIRRFLRGIRQTERRRGAASDRRGA
jgi:pimeloyl-ACP methyl ester carboxylesterase